MKKKGDFIQLFTCPEELIVIIEDNILEEGDAIGFYVDCENRQQMIVGKREYVKKAIANEVPNSGDLYSNSPCIYGAGSSMSGFWGCVKDLLDQGRELIAWYDNGKIYVDIAE